MLAIFIASEKKSDKLLDWLYFLENPKSERVEKNMGENKGLNKAVKELNKISEDERMQRIADLREKAILDEKAIYARGVDVGEEKGRKEIAKRLLKEGFSIEKIIELTNLTEEEIKNLN